jgi:undecaprenyl diphosphate synthase
VNIPRHIAIIMDGNGRWAKQQGKARHHGHKAGAEAVRRVVQACGELGVEALTLFAFSSENWKRPKLEVELLMELFMTALSREVKSLKKNNVKLRVIGELSAFPQRLQDKIKKSIDETAECTDLHLNIAANYGGRWDVANAAKQIASQVQLGELTLDQIDEDQFNAFTQLSDLPEVDLFIRTGGEVRVSNFLLWQIAYSEMVFSDVLWPEFGEEALKDAIDQFSKRQRRFGKTGEQIEEE